MIKWMATPFLCSSFLFLLACGSSEINSGTPKQDAAQTSAQNNIAQSYRVEAIAQLNPLRLELLLPQHFLLGLVGGRRVGHVAGQRDRPAAELRTVLGEVLPKRLAQHPRKGSRLSALELQLVIQGGRRIGQKTRQLGASVTIRRPVLRPLDWLFIAARGLFKQLPG